MRRVRANRRPARSGRGTLVASRSPQRRPRVVRHLARPDELPERRQHVVRGETRWPRRDRPRRAIARRERGANGLRRGAFRRGLGARRAERGARRRGSTRRPDRARRRPRRPRPTRRGRRGPPAGSRHPARKHVALPQRRGQRDPLERNERLAQRLSTSDPVPGGKEAAERGLLGGLDLAAQHGERRAADAAQDVRIAPLALGAAGPKLAADELVLELERGELGLDGRDVEPEPVRDLARRERPMGLRVAPEDTRAARRSTGSRNTCGTPPGGHDAEARRGRDPRPRRRRGAPTRAEPHANRTTLAQERLGEPAVVLAVERAARRGAAGRGARRRSAASVAATPRPARSRRASSSSRSSSMPMSSRRRSRSSESACARRSSGGVSSSYM